MFFSILCQYQFNIILKYRVLVSINARLSIAPSAVHGFSRFVSVNAIKASDFFQNLYRQKLKFYAKKHKSNDCAVIAV